MPPFGYGVGDFITGANLAYRLIHALSTTQGASVEYQEAMHELTSIQQTFLHVGQMRASNILSPATVNAASHIIISSMEVIGKFLDRTKMYQQRLGRSNRSVMVMDSWCRIGWALFKKEELKSLRDTLHVKLSAINVLLSSAQLLQRRDIPIPKILHATSVDTTPSPIRNLGLQSSYELPQIELTNGDLGIEDYLKLGSVLAIGELQESPFEPSSLQSHDKRNLGVNTNDEGGNSLGIEHVRPPTLEGSMEASTCPNQAYVTTKENLSKNLNYKHSSTTMGTDIDARFLRIENILLEQEATRQRASQLKQDLAEEAEVIKAAAARRKAKDDGLSIWTKDMIMTIQYMRAEDREQ